MGLWDTINEITGSIPRGIAGIGSSLAGYYDQKNKRDSLVNAYRDREQRNYDDAKAEYDYWQNTYLPEYKAYQASQDAAAASAASAAAATEENRRRAAKKGMRTEKKYFDQALGNIQPYIDVGHQLLPQVARTYGNSLEGMNMMAGYMNTPQFVARMNQSVPAYKTNIPLPSYIKGA